MLLDKYEITNEKSYKEKIYILDKKNQKYAKM